jgi:hypothetical protein
VRLSGALAALLGQCEGVELWEDEILGMMREHGLLTYPSPLLGRLLEKVPEVLEKEVLARLDATDHAMIAQVARPWLAAVGPGRILLAMFQPSWGAVYSTRVQNAWRRRGEQCLPGSWWRRWPPARRARGR